MGFVLYVVLFIIIISSALVVIHHTHLSSNMSNKIQTNASILTQTNASILTQTNASTLTQTNASTLTQTNASTLTQTNASTLTQTNASNSSQINVSNPTPSTILASNLRILDTSGNATTGAVEVGQQILVTAHLVNNQDKDQPFVFALQIKNETGVTVSLSWITATVSAGKSVDPEESWTPSAAGTYTAQILVLSNMKNPIMLSPPLNATIIVR